MTNINNSNYPNYDVLLAELKYIEDTATEWLKNEEYVLIDRAVVNADRVCRYLADPKKTDKPRYDVLLAQLEFIKKNATEWQKADKQHFLLERATDNLAQICMYIEEGGTNCNLDECHIEDGICKCP